MTTDGDLRLDLIVELVDKDAGLNLMGATPYGAARSTLGAPKRTPPSTAYNGLFEQHPVRLDAKTLCVTVLEGDLETVRALPGVARAYQNVSFEIPHELDIGAAAYVENEDNWGVTNLAAELLHDNGMSGKEVRVAVLDSGIDPAHPSFRTLKLDAFQAFDGGGNLVDMKPSDSQWHGTHVCSVIAGADDGCKRGMAPDVQLSVGRVLEGWRGTVASIKAGLIWVRDIVKPDILNLSLGWPGLHDEWYPEISELIGAGTVVCVASGNEYTQADKHRSPANYAVPGLLAVGAADAAGAVWSGSGGGDFIWPSGSPMEGKRSKLPTLTAPGVEIVSASPAATYRRETGTSMACPHVVGLWAALKSNGRLSGEEINTIIQTALLDGAPQGFDERYGFGVLSGKQLVDELRRRGIL